MQTMLHFYINGNERKVSKTLQLLKFNVLLEILSLKPNEILKPTLKTIFEQF